MPATQKSNDIWATKLAFIYVKRAKAKPVLYRTLGFSEYEMTNAINLKCAFTPASNPKRGAKQYHLYHWPSSEY